MKTALILASYAEVLTLVTRSSPRTRDEPKNVRVGGYSNPCNYEFSYVFWHFIIQSYGHDYSL